MTVELTALGVQCNLSCGYCYQAPMRDAGNTGNEQPYDMDKMFKALAEEGSDFLVFGGEALLVPLKDLITIFEWGYARYKKNGIQTNGVLITPEHIAVFKRLNVHVGFSMDGPDELNDSRWAGTLEKTRAATVKSHANMKACIAAGVPTSMIITLYQGNALPDKLPRLKQWIKDLDTMGCRGVRIHMLEIDHELVKQKMQLTQEQNIFALRELVALESTLKTVRLDILTDMRKLLRADDDSVTCIWNPCDVFNTSAVRGVDGQGNKSNCGRTNKDGINRLKADTMGFARQIAVYHTPQEHGGCQGCRFFLMCKSNCPGTAIDGDWRNRSADCQVWMSLFETLETELVTAGERPLSLDYELRTQVEQAMLPVWARGEHVSLKSAIAQLKQGAASVVGRTAGGGWAVGPGSHADQPHGDSHGDQYFDENGKPIPGPIARVSHVAHGDSDHGDSHGDSDKVQS